MQKSENNPKGVYMYSKDRIDQIRIRVSTDRKERYREAAMREGITLTELIETAVDAYISKSNNKGRSK